MKARHAVTVTLILGCIALVGCKPDLQVSLEANNAYVEGDDVGDTITLTVHNKGAANALGTIDAGANGYMVDLVLSKNTVVPIEWAVVPSPYIFQEDMLLTGGRVSVTKTLAPDESKTYLVAGELPPGSSPGAFLCAVVDPGKKIDESNETNNVALRYITITAP